MPLKVIAVAGSTASGKTAISLPLAERFGGEILSADSMQIYRGMDIGTAKATEEERRRVPHHLIDIVSPDTLYSAADYARDALMAAEEIQSRGRLPIFVGGTGLYLEAARTGRHGEVMESDPEFRRRMETYAEENGACALHERLRACDPESADEIHPNNVRRVIRALEIYQQTGIPKSELDRRSRAIAPKMDMCMLLLTYEDRELLYTRIRARVEEMFRQGLVEEVRTLLRQGHLSENGTAAQAIGYKEILSYLRGECTVEEAMDEVTLATRHYAKRQMTWFGAVKNAHRLRMDENGALRPTEHILRDAFNIVNEFLNCK